MIRSLVGMCCAKTETLAVVREFTFFGAWKILKKLGKINKLYKNTVQKESEPIDVPVKNVKSRTTAKVSVLHRTNQQAL